MSWQRIDEDTYIDDTLISCAEYQLFLDEVIIQNRNLMRNTVPNRPRWHYSEPTPAHWRKNMHPTGQAQSPILGIRSIDAEDFCDWVTFANNSEWRFRLPSPFEANRFPIGTLSSDPLGYWAIKFPHLPEFIWLNDNRPQKLSEQILRKNYKKIFEETTTHLLMLFSERKLFAPDVYLSSLVADPVTHAEEIGKKLVDSLRRNQIGFIFVGDTGASRKYALEILRSYQQAYDAAQKLHKKGEFAMDGRNRDVPVRYDSIAPLLETPLSLAKILVKILELVGDENRSLEFMRLLDPIRIPNLPVPDEYFGYPGRGPYYKLTDVLKYANDFEHFLNIALDMILLEERIAGRSPAFEGIRLVKERIR
jgi:hypothetical protein